MSQTFIHEHPQEICMVDVVEDHSIFGRAILQPESFSPLKSYCSPCGLHFENSTEFEYHIAEFHKAAKSCIQQIEKPNKCSICNLMFKRQDHLKRHIRSLHTEQKYSKCPVCGKEYLKKDVLSQHIKKVHAGNNEIFKCRDCEYECNSLKVLLIHELDHVDRYACPHCAMSYKRRDHLTRHVKSEHMKFVVKCPLCDQVYKRKDHLVRHVKEKHNNRPEALKNHFTCRENV